MTHPLTDEIIEEIAEDVFYYDYSIPIFRQDMRAAYDKGRDTQLEQVIEWLKDNVSHSLLLEVTDKGVNTSKKDKRLLRLDLDWIVDDLREAMRPTTTQEENSND